MNPLENFEEIWNSNRVSSADPDEKIASSVRDLLKNNRRVDTSQILIAVDKRIVTLSGVVNSQMDLATVINLVNAVEGVDEVHSELEIRDIH